MPPDKFKPADRLHFSPRGERVGYCAATHLSTVPHSTSTSVISSKWGLIDTFVLKGDWLPKRAASKDSEEGVVQRFFILTSGLQISGLHNFFFLIFDFYFRVTNFNTSCFFD